MHPKLIVIFGCIHLLVVASDAFNLLQKIGLEDSTLYRATEILTTVTADEAEYSFFSPDIADDVAISFFRRVDLDAPEERVHLKLANAEVQSRMIASLFSLGQLDKADELQMRSFAARIYDAYPDSREITVRVWTVRPPTMAEYRAGKTEKERTLFFEGIYEVGES